MSYKGELGRTGKIAARRPPHRKSAPTTREGVTRGMVDARVAYYTRELRTIEENTGPCRTLVKNGKPVPPEEQYQ